MGVIQRQSLKHAIVSYAGVAIGLLSVIFIYPREEEMYGLFQLLFASSMLCVSIFTLGFNIHAIRFFPVFQNKENRHNGFLGFLLTGGLIGFILFLLLLPFIRYLFLDLLFSESPGKELFTEYFYYLIPIVFLFIFNLIFLKYISNFHRIVIPNILNELLIKVSLPILILLYITGYFDTKMFVQGIVVNYTLALVGLIYYTKSLGQLFFRPDFKFIKKPLRKEIGEYSIFGLLNALGSRLSFTIDTLMVAALVSISSSGGYGIIRVISEVIGKPNQAIQAIASPIISQNLNDNNFEEIEKIYQKSSITLLIIGCYIFLGVWLSLDDLFSIMPTSKATEAGKYVFLFLGLSKLVDLATSVNTIIIGYSKKFKFNFYALLVLAVLNILFNFVFIPKYQMVGAAIATFCSLTIFNVVNVIYVWFHFKIQPFSIATLKILVIIGTCWAAIYFIPLHYHFIINILVRSILLTIMYGGMVLYFNISPDVNGMVKQGFKKVKGIIGM